ncbi:hypothetical protein PoB_007384700 [Plakobranchus ocellatus]|uniref:Uncharacterized protein n=1 Tax=Plakobranchus ocellatus TaxID=259542 RepID=A0AAV4DSP3_9GAST|nr:hypothetical protein PoB_007384700 [Plakobranchus ocellatus]
MTIAVFHNILDPSSVAALVVWRRTHSDSEDKLSAPDNRMLFNIDVAKEMMKPQLERRQAITTLPRYTKAVVDIALEPYSLDGCSTSTGTSQYDPKAWPVYHVPKKK